MVTTMTSSAPLALAISVSRVDTRSGVPVAIDRRPGWTASGAGATGSVAPSEFEAARAAGTGPRRPEARQARTVATMASASSSVSAHTALAHNSTRGSAQRADGRNWRR